MPGEVTGNNVVIGVITGHTRGIERNLSTLDYMD